MSSSDSSDVEAIVCYLYLRLRRKKRRFWVHPHPYIERNIHYRLNVAARELSDTDERFSDMYRMSKNTFKELVSVITPCIVRRNTNMRECIGAEERILITLRFLATGCTFVSLALYFARGDTSISKIIAETTSVIWDTLHNEYMAVPSTEKWIAIANRFNELWNIPNCLGAIDRKHIRIQKLHNARPSNFNFKNHSIILMAACDADGLFTMVETRYSCSNNNGGTFQNLSLTHWLERDGLNLPQSSPLPHDETCQEVPYFFVGSNVFPLKRYLLRPFPSDYKIDNKKRIYNYRFRRGTKTMEHSFNMMSQKFQVLLTPVRCFSYQTVASISKAVCILHNFVGVKDGLQNSAPIVKCDQGNRTQEFNLQEEVMQIHAKSSGATVRKYMSNYFIKPRASLPWQYNYCEPS